MNTDNHTSTTVLAALYRAEKYYGEQTVIEAATLELRAASRIALIGRNGAGKSTILRLLAGSEEPDGGEVFRRPHIEVGVLDQELDVQQGTTLRELSELAFRHLDLMEEQLQKLELAGLDDPERYSQWEELHERFERRGGYARRARRDSVVKALGFTGRLDDHVSHLSGGEKTRLGLARLLMQQPDLLLLDEPTNHLDMEMRDWLSSHLAGYAGSALIISHDRAFLDASCQQTAEVANTRIRFMDGNPSAYRTARAEQERIDNLTRLNQAKEHERLSAAAAQMKSWARQNAKLHRRAKSMERRVERYEATMLDAAEPTGREARFLFDSDESGDIVLQAEHLTRSTGGQPDRVLFKGVQATLRQGDRVALLGPNGTGKTTLLRTLLGELGSSDARGHVRFGARVRVGYYDQELRDVDPERTLIEELIRLTGDVEAHNLLGRFLFPFDAQYKQIGSLSGGEKARLALLKLTLGRYNLLILDEPTNHLDVEMIEALEDALNLYTGTLLLVSHDRRFVAEVADNIWELRDGHLEQYAGDFEYWRVKRAEFLQESAAPERPRQGQKPEPTPQRKPVRNRWQLERRLEALEAEITGLEEELASCTALLEQPGDLTPDDLAAESQRHEVLDSRLNALLDEWQVTGEALAG